MKSFVLALLWSLGYGQLVDGVRALKQRAVALYRCRILGECPHCRSKAHAWCQPVIICNRSGFFEALQSANAADSQLVEAIERSAKA